MHLLPYLLAALVLVQASAPSDDSERARQLVLASKAEEAIAIYNRLLRDFPDRVDLLLNLSIAEYNAKRFADGAQHAEAALKLKPDLAPAELFLGASKLELRQYSAAIDPLQKALSAMPADRNASLMLAQALLGAERYAEAAQAFTKASELVPDSPRVWFGLGQAYDAQGQYRKATPALRKAFQLAPGDANIRLGLARTLFHSQDYEQVVSTLTDLLQQKPTLAEAEFLFGASLLNLQQPQAAVPHLESALKADPQFHAAAAALGQALLQEGKPEQAIPYLKTGLLADADGNAHFQLFRAYQLTGNRQLAKQAFDAYTRYRAEMDQKRSRQDQTPAAQPPNYLLLSLFDRDKLIGRHAHQLLPDSTWPVDLNLVHLFALTRPEMYAKITGGSISDGGRHMVQLIAHTDFCADTIAIALGTNEAQQQPGAEFG